jgi:hypothetical protein
MTSAAIIPSLQSDALAREIERQLKDETDAVLASAERDARAVVAQARGTARRRVHEKIQELRREGERQLVRAAAQREADRRARAQRRAAQAIRDALPLLGEELDARWRDARSRRRWTDEVARLSGERLRPGSWLVEHPGDWSSVEQKEFEAKIGRKDGLAVSFKADHGLKSGLRVKADGAVLDATPRGLLADSRAIAAPLLGEIGEG